MGVPLGQLHKQPRRRLLMCHTILCSDWLCVPQLCPEALWPVPLENRTVRFHTRICEFVCRCLDVMNEHLANSLYSYIHFYTIVSFSPQLLYNIFNHCHFKIQARSSELNYRPGNLFLTCELQTRSSISSL